MKIFVAGLSYKTAPVELREKLAVHASKLRCSGCRVKLAGNLSEAVLVSTCNRVEIYGVTPKVNGNINHIFQHLSGSTDPDPDLSPYLYVKEGSEAVRHLFSVASGLDSLVIGETEITGQVKQAYQAAQSVKLTGRVLNRVFQTALQTAKEIRTQTNIGRGATSVGSVAVELAAYPSCFSAIGLSPATFMIGISGDQRLTFFERSFEFIRHVSPRLVDLKKYWEAM